MEVQGPSTAHSLRRLSSPVVECAAEVFVMYCGKAAGRDGRGVRALAVRGCWRRGAVDARAGRWVGAVQRMATDSDNVMQSCLCLVREYAVVRTVRVLRVCSYCSLFQDQDSGLCKLLLLALHWSRPPSLSRVPAAGPR